MMSSVPPIIDYARGGSSPLPLAIEQTTGGFRLTIQGERAAKIATAGWLAASMLLGFMLLSIAEPIGDVFLCAFLFCAVLGLLISIRDLQQKVIELSGGMLTIDAPRRLFKHRVSVPLLVVRNIYFAGEAIYVRELDGRVRGPSSMGSEVNARAVLQILKEMLPGLKESVQS
jgi:hypothetical protein